MGELKKWRTFDDWVRAMYDYHFVSRQVDPWRVQLRDKDEEICPHHKELQNYHEQISDKSAESKQLWKELELLGPL